MHVSGGFPAAKATLIKPLPFVVSPSVVLRTDLSNDKRNQGAMRSLLDAHWTSMT
jgi:hypothetical protein